MIDPTYFLHDELIECKAELKNRTGWLIASVVLNVFLFLVVFNV